MGARETWRLVQHALKNPGEDVDLLAGEKLAVVPEVNDQGSFEFGNATKDMDVKVFLGGAGAYVLFDSGSTTLTLSGVNLVAPDVAISGTSTIAGTVTNSAATTLTGTIKASTDGWIGQKVVTEATAARTVDATDFDALILLTGGAGITTVTLPAAAAGNLGAKVTVVSQSNHAHVVALTNGIIAPNTVTSDSITAADVDKTGQVATLVSNGAKWVVVALTGSWTTAA